MSERGDAAFLADMLACAAAIASYTAGRTRDELEGDGMLQDAVVRRLEILGEAANNVSHECRHSSPGIPWPAIIGMRNLLIHAYHPVDVELVWQACSVELPRIVPEIERLVREAAGRS